ncbi:unnamed protein product, partial [marine sediment metagenome]
TVYAWPGAYPAQSDYLLVSSDTGELNWMNPGAMGLGTITAVGDVTSGAAFTEDVTQGTSLWFHDSGQTGKLTIGTLTANATYTLPDLTGVVALQQADTLTEEGVLFADSLGRIIQDTDFTYSTSTNMLQVGGGGIKLLGSTGNYIGLKAPATSDETTYAWPGTVIGGRVLTTDASGNLSWESVEGVGGIAGSGTVNMIAKFTAASTIGDSSISDSGSLVTVSNPLTLSGSGSNLTVEGTGTSTFFWQFRNRWNSFWC